MPIYEFDCQGKCQGHFEFVLGIGKSKTKCPECGGRLKKVLFSKTIYHDTSSPMHPRRGRGLGGYGRVDCNG